MSNSYFQFKQFIIHQDKCAMKVTTDACLFGAWAGERVGNQESEAGSREPGVQHILDIGTGSGLLALMLAQVCEFSIEAIEIDKDTFEQASENVAASPWVDRIKVFHADAREFKSPYQYDIIISNPPFYENELKADNAKKNLAHHNEGLVLPELLNIIKKTLKPGGTFYLLLPFKRNEEIKKLLTESNLLVRQMTFARQSINHDYFRIMLAGKLKRAEPGIHQVIETMIDEISIKNDAPGSSEEQYTPDFVNLLKDYYLHL